MKEKSWFYYQITNGVSSENEVIMLKRKWGLYYLIMIIASSVMYSMDSSIGISMKGNKTGIEGKGFV